MSSLEDVSFLLICQHIRCRKSICVVVDFRLQSGISTFAPRAVIDDLAIIVDVLVSMQQREEQIDIITQLVLFMRCQPR